jgi:ATP-binding cassette subfamily B protein
VGERGVTLSGGQKQRAAIARMLTRETPIMIFDDSLSAVDTETDAKIRAALEKRFGSATIILISHRITTLSRADKVLVLDHGRAAQLGTPEELSRQPGLYRQIEQIQSMSAEEVRA